MDCNKFAKYEMEYIDGSLKGKKLKQAEEHLAVCPHCRERVQLYRQMSLAMAQLPEEQPTEAFTRSVMQQVKSLPDRRRVKAVAFVCLLSVITALSSVMGFVNLLCQQQSQIIGSLRGSAMAPLAKAVELAAGLGSAVNGLVATAFGLLLGYLPLVLWVSAVALTTVGMYTALKNTAGGRLN